MRFRFLFRAKFTRPTSHWMENKLRFALSDWRRKKKRTKHDLFPWLLWNLKSISKWCINLCKVKRLMTSCTVSLSIERVWNHFCLRLRFGIPLCEYRSIQINWNYFNDAKSTDENSLIQFDAQSSMKCLIIFFGQHNESVFILSDDWS